MELARALGNRFRQEAALEANARSAANAAAFHGSNVAAVNQWQAGGLLPACLNPLLLHASSHVYCCYSPSQSLKGQSRV